MPDDVVYHCSGGVGGVFGGSLDVVLVQVGDGVFVVESHERAGGRGEVGVEGLDEGGHSGVGQQEVDRFADL